MTRLKKVVGWLAMMGLVAVSVASASATGGQWIRVARMNVARGAHTLTLLPGGRVLAVGGDGPETTEEEAEVFDPGRNTWTLTGPTVYLHADHAATMLADGRVLVTGGDPDADSAEVYDPVTNTWMATPPMSVERTAHTATLLADGRVLVAGGCGENDCTIRATELYDPATNTWSPAGLLALGRGLHQAARLPDGRVMVVGGTDGNVQFRSTEIYDPATGQWTTGPQLHDGRSRFGLTSVRRGAQALYLAASGCCVGGSISLLRTAEVYDPSRNQWFRVGNLNRPRKEFGFTTLGDGSALAAGGENREVFQQTSERFDPQTLMWQLTADNIPKAVAEVPLVTLDNGLALIAGGKLSDETEVQTPAAAVFQP